MIFNRLAATAVPAVKNISTSSVRLGHTLRGVPGTNLPFQVKNRYRLTAVAILYIGSALAFPFLALRQMILNKNQD